MEKQEKIREKLDNTDIKVEIIVGWFGYFNDDDGETFDSLRNGILLSKGDKVALFMNSNSATACLEAAERDSAMVKWFHKDDEKIKPIMGAIEHSFELKAPFYREYTEVEVA